MATQDKEPKRSGISRRSFLKISGAAAAAGTAGLDFAFNASTAHAANVAATYHTTCPYCSASCGQLVDVDADGNVLDVYGDAASPINNGGLCAKGAGAYQLVTNSRRLGAFPGTHPVSDVFAARAQTKDGTVDGAADDFTNGVAYTRTGNAAWSAVGLDYAMDQVAASLKTARDSTGAPAATNGYNSKGVAFFGCSHMNNEQNYTYRKLIAQFGSSNTEHQARI